MAAYTNPRRCQWNGDDHNLLTSDDCSVSSLTQNLCITNDDKNFCLLDRLADIPEMAHIVISMLTYNELVNLACVNKKWYKTVVKAPQSVKPRIMAKSIYLNEGRAIIHLCTYSITLPMKNTFNMIQRIDTYDCVVVDNDETEEIEYKNTVESLQFLVDHRNDFLIKLIEFSYPLFANIDYSLLSGLFSSFRNFVFSYGFSDIKMPDLWRQELQKAVLENLALESIRLDVPLDLEFLQVLLVQVASGQRPNFLLKTMAGLENRADFIQIVRDIDPSQLRHIDENKFEIEVPSLDKCFVVEQFILQFDRPTEWCLMMNFFSNGSV